MTNRTGSLAAGAAPASSPADEKAALLKRNVNFLKRCADMALDKGESIRMGPWMRALPTNQKRKLLDQIFAYDGWNEKTDPTGTHANGVVMFDGHHIMFVIRLYDTTPSSIMFATTPPEMIELCLLIKHSSEI